MVARSSRPPETLDEIARRHGRSLHTVRNHWAAHPQWPAPVGKRGRWLEYAPATVDTWVSRHAARPAVELDPGTLYTQRQIADDPGTPSYGTIRGDRSRGRWPDPDDTGGGTPRWYGRTVTAHMEQRQAWGRSGRSRKGGGASTQ